MLATHAQGEQTFYPGFSMLRISYTVAGLACLATLGMMALLARPAAAAGEPYAAVEVLRGWFISYDYNHDGRISVREVNTFSELISVSMDTNDDGRVSLEEFLTWDPGFASLAGERGKMQEFEAAKRVVFEARDYDKNGYLDQAELVMNSAHDFVAADRDHNGYLDPGEFAHGYPILAAIARALH